MRKARKKRGRKVWVQQCILLPWLCHAPKCGSTHCYMPLEGSDHFALGMKHFDVWAAAMVCRLQSLFRSSAWQNYHSSKGKNRPPYSNLRTTMYSMGLVTITSHWNRSSNNAGQLPRPTVLGLLHLQSSTFIFPKVYLHHLFQHLPRVSLLPLNCLPMLKNLPCSFCPLLNLVPSLWYLSSVLNMNFRIWSQPSWQKIGM